ncbi:acyl-CoA dehydrogenase family protein [Paraburkholderia sp. BCC1886]|uniref:acyl-CoA dehydrogenase family protein n=1 Tax=Paraburkholderia sp. BCC1886 TaxID=2562670 RepID=UPI00118250D6|nr:acyl-CoA dehydrogenase family protein [Paraburkholderia sp. BCC1886]
MTSSGVQPEISELEAWLDANAEAIDTGQALAPEILPWLGRAGVFRVGVPAAAGGAGGSIGDAIEAVAKVAEHSLAAAFVFWGQRTFIEYVLQSPNLALRKRWLDALLSGELAGATGLSNAMKYLSNIEPLQMKAQSLGNGQWTLDGSLPWITNLRPQAFVAALAFDHAAEQGDMAPSIFAITHDANGVTRSEDLDLIALRASNTAALQVRGTVVDESSLITADAPTWLAHVRPAFLGLQCGMSVGLARRSLAVVGESGAATRAAVADEARQIAADLDALTHRLKEGVQTGIFVAAPAALFEIRIALAALVQAAIGLEVQVSGGRGYLRGQGGTARRAREAAFVPIITPSLVQLKNQLALHRKAQAA